MEFEKIVKILKGEGYKKDIVYNESELKEKPSHPEDSYYFLVKEGDNWILGYINMERGKNKEETIGKYSSLKEGANNFFLNRLREYYLFNHVSKAKNDAKIIELLLSKKLVLNDLLNALRQYIIPVSYLSTQEINRHSIRMIEEKSGWISEYIDIKGNCHKKTKALSLSECISVSFARIMYLYLLDNVTMKYLGGIKSYEYFTPEQIAFYVG